MHFSKQCAIDLRILAPGACPPKEGPEKNAPSLWRDMQLGDPSQPRLRTPAQPAVENSVQQGRPRPCVSLAGSPGTLPCPTAPSYALLGPLPQGLPWNFSLLFQNEALTSHPERNDCHGGTSNAGTNRGGDSNLLITSQALPGL